MTPTAFQYSGVTKRRIQWLWYPFIQRGAINLLTGGPGTGKSTIACDIAAALSVGRPLPGDSEEQAAQRGVLKTWIFNAEDDPEDTIVWRLENQKADLTKIYGRPLSGPISPDNIKEIRDFIRAEGIGLIVIDPVQAWIPASTDMHRANQMRDWGNLFRNLCLDTGVTVLWVRHRRKGDADDQNSLNSGLGSIDMSGIVRSEMGALVTKAGSRITRIKGSVGPTNMNIEYRIAGTDNDHGQLKWSGNVAQGKPLSARAPKKGSSVQAWLLDKLSAGPMPVEQALDECSALTGAGKSTIRERAKEVVVREVRAGEVYWRLRTPEDTNDQASIDADQGPDNPT